MTAATDSPGIERLERMMGDGFKELKDLYSSLDQRLRTLEQQQGRPCEIEAVRMSQREQEIKDLRGDLVQLQARVDWLEPWVKGLRWVAGALGVSVVALIWGILTHAISLTFH